LRTARAAVQRALETRVTDEAEHWRAPGVAQGVVRPRRTWRSDSGHWCREFEESILLDDGRNQTTAAIRCRSGDGRWRPTGE